MAALALLPLLGFILLWRRVTGSRSSSAALHAASAVLLILYVGALAGHLFFALVLLLTSGTLLAMYELASLVRHRRALPVPVGILLILCAVFALLHYDAAYYLYDEYSHWGIFLKELLANDALWGSESNALVLRYPPGAPLWQYFFLRLTESSEGGAYLAQFCLLMLPLTVLWQNLKWRQLCWLLAIFALVAVTLSNFGHGFSSLYVDHVLATWFAGIIFGFMLDLKDRTPRQLLSYLLPLTTLVLIKDSGLYFATAAVSIMSLLVFWKTAYASNGRKVREGLIGAGSFALVCIASAGLIVASWNANRNAAGIPPSAYSTGGIISGITSGSSNLGADDQEELGRRFRDVVFHQQISKDKVFTSYNEFKYYIMPVFTDRFRLTTASLILLFVLWQAIVLYKIVDREERWRWTIVATGCVLSAIVYLCILFLSYRFAFDDKGIILPSYLRYAYTALLPLVLLFFLPLLPGFSPGRKKFLEFSNDRKIGLSGTVFAGILGALLVFETPYLLPLYKNHEAPAVRYQFSPFIESVRNVVGDARLWIYLPVPDADAMLGRIFLYELTPLRAAVVTDLAFLNQGPGVMQDVIAEWDYLWFPVQNPMFDQNLRAFFGEDLKDRVFRIDRSGATVDVVALSGVFDQI
ncbi:MAG: hypothetical protein O2880_01980 [Proteobacteria bacterium]|nr:hypothetical protein [Pseudomonadota bacterium]